jgi:glycosyltransferase involved in cell wall biosynthesis
VKILHLIQKPQRRGAEVFAFQLSKELRQEGHKVRIAYLYPYSGPGALPLCTGDCVLRGEENHPLETVPGFHPALLGHVREVIEAFQPDVVQANGGRTVKYGALARRLERRRQWVLVYRNIGHPKDWMQGWHRRMFYRLFVMPQMDGVAGVSRVTLQAVVEFHGLQVPAVHIPVGINPEALVPSRARAEVRREIGTPLEGLVVVSVGSLTSEKRGDRMLRVMRWVVDEMPETHLWLVGDGPMRQSLEQQAQGHGLSAHVHFLGVQQEVASFLNAADLFLLTSDTEGIPAAVLEAGWLELPVVATRVGGLPECVQDGATGILVDPDDEAGLTQATVNLLREPDLRERMGEAARQRVGSRYTMQVVTQQYLDFYRHVLNHCLPDIV